MDEVEENPSCNNCKRLGILQRLPCQIHYVCSQCFEEYVKNKNETEFHFCRCPVPSTSQQRPRSFTSPGQSNGSIQNTLPTPKSCTVCKYNISDADVQFCKECCKILCFNCSIRHKTLIESKMHTIHPFSLNNKPHCSKHEKKTDYFCPYINCNKSLCKSCIKYGHKHHELCKIETISEDYRDAILKMTKSNDEKCIDISFQISMLNTKRMKMKETVKDLESDLEKRRDCILRIVNEEFENQIKNLRQKHAEFISEIKEEIRKLREILTDLESLSELSLHYSNELVNYNVLRDYNAFKSYSDTNLAIQIDSVKFNTLAFANSKFDCSDMQDTVKTLFGEINIVVEEDAILQNLSNREESFLNFVEFCEFKKFCVTDICYDSEQEVLYVLGNTCNKFSILKCSEGSTSKLLQLKLNNITCMRILPLLNRKVLVQTSTDFKIVSINTRLYADISIPLWYSHNVLAMCASHCREFVFLCIKEYWVCKYNPITQFSEIAAINLPNDCLWMSVSQNLDYIVFTGYFHTVCLYSFNQKRMLHVFNDSLSPSYQYATFTSENIFVAFDSSTSLLMIFSAEKKRLMQKITNFKCEKMRKVEDIGRVSALTVGASNTLYVHVSDTNTNKIYKVMLD